MPRQHLYAWAVVGLLLWAAAITVPRLDYDAYSNDEVRSLVVIGAAHYAPVTTPATLWARVRNASPDQAYGYPLVAWGWERLTGPSELARRSLSLFAGLLTIALAYRAGALWAGPVAGLGAALMLSTSLYFITFMHKGRVYTLAALAALALVWFYGQAARTGRTRPAVGLALAAGALLHSHYFAVTVGGGVALYHLLFAREVRRWWLPLVAAAAAGVAFVPQLTVLLQGVAFNQEKSHLLTDALSPPEIVAAWATYTTNGVPWLLLPVLVGAGWALVSHWSARLVVVTVGGALAGVIAVHLASGLFVADRVRYLAGLWGPGALLVGVGVWRLWAWRRWVGWGMLLAWGVVGVWAIWDDTLMNLPSGDEQPPLAWREVREIVLSTGEPDDVVFYQGVINESHGYYTHGIASRPVVPPYMPADERRATVATALDTAKRAWWMVQGSSNTPDDLALVGGIFDDYGFVRCATAYDDGTTYLHLMAAHPAYCPRPVPPEPLASFNGGQYTLSALGDPVREGDTLTLASGWHIAPPPPPYTYSVGFHLTDADGVLVAQADLGLEAYDGPYSPLRAVLDVGGLPQGDYPLYALVYNWQTGDRLPGTSAPVMTITLDDS